MVPWLVADNSDAGKPSFPKLMPKSGVGGAFGSLIKRGEINQTDASSSRSADERGTLKHPHPILTDIRVRQALLDDAV